MAQLERLRNKVLLLLMLVFCACNTKTPQRTAVIDTISLNRNVVHSAINNGILIVDGNPYSGTLFTFYEGTTDTAEVTRYFKGKENGEWKKFYPSGKTQEVRFFSNGQKVGHYLAWWENGSKQLDYFFKADEYEGECREWNEEGLLTKKMHYKKGYEEGPQQWWYDNGKIKANYIIKNGRRYGLLGTKNCTNASDEIFSN